MPGETPDPAMIHRRRSIIGARALAAAIWLAAAGIAPAIAQTMDESFAAYERGDYATAYRGFLKHAEQGDASAQVFIGVMYHLGDGVPQDHEVAAKWYRRAADQGVAYAQDVLGDMHYHGEGVPQDYAVAARWYRRAADQGYASAQRILGDMYYYGKGVPQGYAVAATWFGRAALQGDAYAQGSLGYMYHYGEGVPQDYAVAARWYRRAADQGYASAHDLLGDMYYYGEGVPQDYAIAATWYRHAADHGNAYAQGSLGYMYHYGEGVPQDYAVAATWFRRAADQGNAYSQHSLGHMYSLGNGVPQDYVYAYKWLDLAASSHLTQDSRERAARDRDLVALHLSSTQLSRAQRLSREWRPTGTQYRTHSRPERLERAMTGSGFRVSTDGHILTNAHVVRGCSEVRAPAGMPVRVVAYGAADLALLESSSTSPDAVAAFRQGRGIRSGAGVVVVGHPFDGMPAAEASVSAGIVSALAGPGDDRRLIQITAPVQPGNSGGPVLDSAGNVIGVVLTRLNAHEFARDMGYPQTVNFAVAAGAARAFLNAESVPYLTAPSQTTLPTDQVATTGKRFTVLVECWNPKP